MDPRPILSGLSPQVHRPPTHRPLPAQDPLCSDRRSSASLSPSPGPAAGNACPNAFAQKLPPRRSALLTTDGRTSNCCLSRCPGRSAERKNANRKAAHERPPAQLQAFPAYNKRPKGVLPHGPQLSPIKIRSTHNAWAVLRTFFKWAEKEHHTGRPDKSIPPPKLMAEGPVQPFTEDEVHRLIAAAESVKAEAKDGRNFRICHPLARRNVAIIVVPLDSGLRVSELCRLDIRDYNPMSGEVTVKAHSTAQKTHGRLVYLGKRARQILWRYLADREEQRPHDPLFPSSEDRRMDGNAVYQALKRIAHQANVPKCHPHRFHHTAAIQFLRNGGNVFVLQRILGRRTGR